MSAKKTLNKLRFVIVIATIMAFWPALVPADHYHTVDGGQGSNDPEENQPKNIWDKLGEIIKNLLEGGDPVHLGGGEYYLSVADLRIRGRALDVVIQRRYSSRSEYNSRFGYGWDMNYNIKVRKLHDPNTIVLLNGENRRLEYTLDPNSDPNEPLYISPAGLYDFITENGNGTFTLVRKHGTEIDFDINGNLSAITDRNGNSITFTYDSNGLLPLNGPSKYFVGQEYGLVAREYKLTTITDDLGRDINFSYDANGLLSTITDFADRTWTYIYDASNNPWKVIGPNTVDWPDGLTTTYAYEDSNDIHNLTSAIDANGQTYLVNTYDANDRVEEQTLGDGTYYFSYNPDSNEVTVTDRRTFDTTSTYNNSGNPLSYTIYTTGLRLGDPNSYTTSYEYNSDREVTRIISPAGNWIDYTYDTNGNLLSICHEPNDGEPNIVISYTYEANFNFVKTIKDPRGNEVTLDYNDLNGNLEKITYPTVSTPDGDKVPVVSLTYNQYGQLETATAPDGIITNYVYYNDANDANDYGRLWKVIVDSNESDPNRLEITTEYKYDNLGRVVEVTDPNGDKTSFVYNNLEQLTQIKAPTPYSYVTNFSYNKNKNLSQVEGVRTNDPNQITSFTYDILDNLKTVTNPLGYVTKYNYDASENLSDINDAEESNTHYDYDERDLLLKVVYADDSNAAYSYTDNGYLKESKDPNGDITTYSYDGFDRLTCITYPDDSNEVFGYDAASNLTSFKNRKGETIYYEYDALNRLVVENRPDEPNITYLYDIVGRVVEVDDGGDVTEYYYDRIGRLSDVNDPEGRLVSYEYDNRGLRTQLIYPDDSNVTYEYDAIGRIRKIKYQGELIAEYDYDELSRRTLLTLGNDSNVVYEYDLGNRLKKLTNNINDVNSIVFDYNDYDKVGNRLSCKIDDANASIYSYDELYQLTLVDYNDGNSTSYSYDSLGNRVEVNDVSITSYSRNSLNQYTSVGDINYDYDDNGNLIDINDGRYEYVYDWENQLTDVNENGQATASYSYDHLGRRISKVVSGITTKYCYDGGQVIAEYDANNTLLRKFIYGPGIDEPICIVDAAGGDAIYYFHFDGLGSIVALSNNSGEIVEQCSYDVFGKATIRDANGSVISQSAFGNPYLFSGRRYDFESGLYYYRARYYNSSLGRFLQPDPIGYDYKLNFYTYCVNNPLNWVDPLGLDKQEDYFDAVDLLELIGNPDTRGALPYYMLHGYRVDYPGLSEVLHGVLDFAGIVFEPADALNAYIYAKEGAYGDAVISTAACVPLIGDISKVGKYGAKYSDEAAAALKQSVKQLDEVPGVYKVTAKTGEAYVGQSVNMGARASRHLGSGGKFGPKSGLTAVSVEYIPMPGSTPVQRRVVEQQVVNTAGGKKAAKVLNQRNPVAQKYWTQYGIEPPK